MIIYHVVFLHTDQNKSSVEAAKRQVEENKEFLEDWIGADFNENWLFLSIVFTLELDDEKDIRSCDNCNLFIACGKEELSKKLKRVYDYIQLSRIIKSIMKKEVFKNDPEEFKLVAKYFLFCSPVVALPIGGNYNKAVA